MPDELRQPVPFDAAALDEEKRGDQGPLEWIAPTLVSAFARLVPREVVEEEGRRGFAGGPPPLAALLGGDDDVLLATPDRDRWRDVLREFKERKAEAVAEPARRTFGAPAVPGGRNWLSLGPTVVRRGQTVGDQSVGGRVSGIAVVPGGGRLYAATANGGVFRSDDGAVSWRSMMDGFDLDPTNFATASLVCGAIAVDPADPDRVYVGTGEGATDQMFARRVTSALPSYRGVGPILSRDGGETWESESSTPDLAGFAFYALAVDPEDGDHVVAATTNGLYERVPSQDGGFHWLRRRKGVHSSVVVTSGGGQTRFYAAEWGEEVYQSSDGATWEEVGQADDHAFPDDDFGRVSLGVRPDDPSTLLALAATEAGRLHGLFRLDDIGDAGGGPGDGSGDGTVPTWRSCADLPDLLPGSQGSYDLAIAVDPLDPDVVYLGGDRLGTSPFPASIWRCELEAAGSAWRVARTASLGRQAHSDVHVLTHTPGEPDELWTGTDGGLFLNRDPRGSGNFSAQNEGLACLCSNFLGQHPTDPGILFTGLQDNGTAHTGGTAAWTRVTGGDGGYCLVNSADPDQVLVFQNGQILKSTDGGAADGNWHGVWNLNWATMTQPIVGAPFDAADPATGSWVAAAAGRQVLVSSNFATSWDSGGFAVPGGSGNVFTLAFARPDRLFAGTTQGRVFRADKVGADWQVERLDDAFAGPLGLSGLITDVAVDWGDPERESLYVIFGGQGDARRVWRWDGTAWESRSGDDPESSLLDIEHNALEVDPQQPDHLYAGGTIGVWHSADAGRSWQPMQNGLPDAPVFDLKIHPAQRLLRAATHGRGVYEIEL